MLYVQGGKKVVLEVGGRWSAGNDGFRAELASRDGNVSLCAVELEKGPMLVLINLRYEVSGPAA
jgi:hypothetical protein